MTQTTVDLCKHDGQPCYASAGTNDAHWRCGTAQCSPAQSQTTERAARYARVEASLSGQIICGRCNATLETFSDVCPADLLDRCPGFEAIEAAGDKQ